MLQFPFLSVESLSHPDSAVLQFPFLSVESLSHPDNAVLQFPFLSVESLSHPDSAVLQFPFLSVESLSHSDSAVLQFPFLSVESLSHSDNAVLQFPFLSVESLSHSDNAVLQFPFLSAANTTSGSHRALLYRTDLEKWTHQETIMHESFWQKIIILGCKKIDNKRRSKEQDKKTLAPSSHQLLLVYPFLYFLLLFLLPKKTIFVESAWVLLFTCFLSCCSVHFPRSVLFCQSHQQCFTLFMESFAGFSLSFCSKHNF